MMEIPKFLTKEYAIKEKRNAKIAGILTMTLMIVAILSVIVKVILEVNK